MVGGRYFSGYMVPHVHVEDDIFELGLSLLSVRGRKSVSMALMRKISFYGVDKIMGNYTWAILQCYGQFYMGNSTVFKENHAYIKLWCQCKHKYKGLQSFILTCYLCLYAMATLIMDVAALFSWNF